MSSRNNRLRKPLQGENMDLPLAQIVIQLRRDGSIRTMGPQDLDLIRSMMARALSIIEAHHANLVKPSVQATAVPDAESLPADPIVVNSEPVPDVGDVGEASNGEVGEPRATTESASPAGSEDSSKKMVGKNMANETG